MPSRHVRPGRREGRSLPNARLLSAHGCGREHREDHPGDHPGDAAHDPIRAAGTPDRPRSGSVDGAQEARRLLLMFTETELIQKNIEAYLLEHQRKDLLRFLTCGSVDDGKSTLIGRLL